MLVLPEMSPPDTLAPGIAAPVDASLTYTVIVPLVGIGVRWIVTDLEVDEVLIVAEPLPE